MTMRNDQRARMLAGELYNAEDPHLQAAHLDAQALLATFNATPADAAGKRQALLSALFGGFGVGSVVRPALRCDYGFNIILGKRCFVNYDCVLLDCNRITLGDEVQLAPGVHIYTATHPLEPIQRRAGLEYALPVAIADGVWLGGGAIVCPGVSIGENTVVGAGSVVTRDLPANVVAAGNPCRVIRPLPHA
ncbi:MAG: sugar O-acetyltransferase [Pseudomonadota bacterium]|uniref:sugar O-acetyltransferase n=1 Tax=Halomonas sp. IOP_31 TaxID=2876584 RepID=UPI001E5315AA|nr:sugar O-acetyltransferase [Halomonas sp. IOP_31]MCD6008949.1 sugar O-acetyltransferase [Halomonas sp. IOP_31]MEA3251907.1 sugar O-acetyltransferase [Pseudomonadota bacterium]